MTVETGLFKIDDASDPAILELRRNAGNGNPIAFSQASAVELPSFGTIKIILIRYIFQEFHGPVKNY